MPKEQINYPNDKATFIIDRFGSELEHELDVDIPDSSMVIREPTLSVHWMPDNHVQLSLNMDPNYIKHVADSLSDEVTNSAVFTPALSRQEINKLIRVLRVARDKVHGRDE